MATGADRPSAAQGDRTETMKLLERAALELIAENGVLAGLNLRAVAERANVNRGLVYLYFGGRQDLLRSALWRSAASTPTWGATRRSEQPLPARAREDLRVISEAEDQTRLVTLLHLDGDNAVRVLPNKRESLRLLARDRSEGRVPEDLDLEALHVILVAVTAGYALFRQRFAAELGDLPARTDVRVGAVLERLLQLLEEAGSAADPASDDLR